MKERPILFSSPMVRAILEGQKSMTRRVIKPQPAAKMYQYETENEWYEEDDEGQPKYHTLHRSPYGVKGDRLWVRETWRPSIHVDHGCAAYRSTMTYRCGLPVDPAIDLPWRPSIFMKRADSRITVEVTGVRVERVQDISEHDQYWEGLVSTDFVTFAGLWDSINAKRRYGWDMNPWVWVIEFKRVESKS